jgi:transglycosylase-like protein
VRSGPLYRQLHWQDEVKARSRAGLAMPALPAHSLAAVPSFGDGPRQLEEATPAAIPPSAARPRRGHSRKLRRVAGAVVAVAALGAIVFAGLLLVLPGVSNAPVLAQDLARTHHALYPGPVLPPRVAAALVATEDHRFYTEPGIDPAALGRVILGHLTRSPDQGGSTLYQQLARMLYLPGRSGMLAEAEQVLLGIKLDLSYPKAEILQMYAGVVYFGHGYHGLAAASCGYFGQPPADLSWGQAAMLAGLVQAPSADDPLAHFANARARQVHVLIRLIATGKLTPAQAARAYWMPLHLIHGHTGACQ